MRVRSTYHRGKSCGTQSPSGVLDKFHCSAEVRDLVNAKVVSPSIFAHYACRSERSHHHQDQDEDDDPSRYILPIPPLVFVLCQLYRRLSTADGFFVLGNHSFTGA